MALVVRLQLFKPSETFIAAQAAALRRYRPVHLGWRLHGSPPDGVPWRGAKGWREALQLFGLGRAGRLAAALPAGRTVVHAHFAVDALFALALARRIGAPLVVTLHGFDVSRRRRALLASGRPALVAFVLGWPLLRRRAALFLAVSDRVAEAALRRGVDSARLRRQPIGVDTRRLRPAGGGEAGLVVFVGRLVEKKGAAVLLEAVHRLRRDRPDVRAVLVGDGPLRPRLAAAVRRLGLQGCVELAGALPHDDALGWMRRAAVVVVPSLQARDGDAEGLPTVLLEAAALGRAVVASEAGAAGALEPGRREALVVPSGDPEALARALARALADDGLRAELGRAARARVEADYDLARRTGELEALYDALLAAAPPRG